MRNVTLSSMIARQSPGESGAAETVSGKKRQAKHELVDAQGNVLGDDADETAAWGIRYSLLALPGKSFTYIYGQNADCDRMLANFGAKTLATNETSAARNSDKGEASAVEQLDAVVDRFAPSPPANGSIGLAESARSVTLTPRRPSAST
jgi:hypothetical protein